MMKSAPWLWLWLTVLLPVGGNVRAADPWPAEANDAAVQLTGIDSGLDAINWSGASWNPETRTLWLACNSGYFWALVEDGSGGFQVATNGAGTPAKWSPGGDLEAICQADFSQDLVYLMDEDGWIREYDVSQNGVVDETRSWDVRAHCPEAGGASGGEGLAFIPDEWLQRQAFRQADGTLYASAHGMGGLMFVGYQADGYVYAFDLDRGTGSFTFVGRYKTGWAETAGLEFDRATGKLYVWHNVGSNFLEVTELNSTVDGPDRRLRLLAEYVGPRTGNLEGFALAPANATQAAGGCILTDDDNLNQEAVLWYRQFQPSDDTDADGLSDGWELWTYGTTTQTVGPLDLAVAPTSRVHSAAAAVGQSIAVTAIIPWTAAAHVPWLRITSGNSGTTHGTVTYGVEPNAGAFRSGTITVSGGGIDHVFTVNQAARNVPVAGDFDGDGAADAATFQAAGGRWDFLYSAGGSANPAFGWWAVVPVPADYDGDGRSDLAVYHPASGNWYVRPSGGGADRVEAFGWNATIPLPGDYDGDGLADLVVFHRPTAQWYFRYSSGGPDYNLAFGWSAVLPVPADYDGDGVVDLAVYHPATGNWYCHESSTGEVVVRQLGGGPARPVPADYDGDGAADVAVFTRATARWQVTYSGGGRLELAFGWSSVVPVPADYDGDGKADLAVYHPAGGKWYVRQSSDGATAVKTLGGPGKNPVLLNSLIHSWYGLP